MCGNTCTGFVGNVLWLIVCGWVLFLAYSLFAVLLCITIIGFPFGRQLAFLALWPFGKTIVRKESAGSFCSTFMNVIWFLLGGIWLALLHTFFGILFAITIIGLPCARQHFKMASLAIYPFGLEVASDEETTHIHHQHQQRQPGYQVA